MRYTHAVMEKCFKQLKNPSARVLILGSMPGIASLDAQQYYAHPRNCFWWILQEITGVDCNETYEKRMQGVLDAGIALWDVIAECERSGSLDSAINLNTLRVNDFKTFFKTHSNIKSVFLNGGKAYDLFHRHIVRQGVLPADINAVKLPSTSPAFAAMTKQQKKLGWLKQFAQIQE